jgi:hypothetical protein
MAASNEPYVGPRPFEEHDGRLFFGRDQEASELVSLITAHPVVLLYAQSGAGKTSLVKAALMALLANNEGFNVLPAMRVREQVRSCAAADQITNIYMFNALMSLTRYEPGELATDYGAKLAALSLADFLQQQKENGVQAESGRPTVLIFDQFEEFFTLYPERWEERQRFFQQISQALAADSLLRVLFSMREDFIAELDPYAFCLPEKLRTRYRVERLNRRKALVAITQPLNAIESSNGSRSFAAGAAEELVDNLLMVDVKTAQGPKRVKGKFVEALQLQVVCQTLWNSLGPEDKLITKDQLLTFGNVDRALTAFYQNAIVKTNQKTGVRTGALRHWCERALITPAGTRAPVFRDEKATHGLTNEAVDELERQSLLRMELRGGARWYELTHDRFVEIIKQSNQQWLVSLPGAKQNLLSLEKRAEIWDENNRPDAELLSEEELFETDRWLKSSEASEFELGSRLAAYLFESQKALDTQRKLEEDERRRIEEKAETANKLRRLAYALAIISVLMIGVSIFGFWEWRQAKIHLGEANRLRSDAEIKASDLKRTLEALQSTEKKLTASEETKARSAIAAAAYKELTGGDLDGAARDYNQIVSDSNVVDPLERAEAYFGLGDVEFYRRPPAYKKAIQHYDEALNAVGYDAAGKQLNSDLSTGSVSAQDLKERAAFYLREKGELYQVWGESLADDGNPKAEMMFKNAWGFYHTAKGFGGSGVSQASEGMAKAKASQAKLTAGSDSEQAQQAARKNYP